MHLISTYKIYFFEMEKLKYFEELFEDAYATLGNTGGMGPVVASQPSAIPGDVAGSTPGSGDIAAVDHGTSFGAPFTFDAGRKKGKKRRKAKFSTKQPSTGVMKFVDWSNVINK